MPRARKPMCMRSCHLRSVEDNIKWEEVLEAKILVEQPDTELEQLEAEKTY